MGEEPAPFCIYYAEISKHGGVDYDSHCKSQTIAGSKLSSFPVLARHQLILLFQALCIKGTVGTQALLIFTQAEHASADASGSFA